jgi:hypothetical protein
MDKTRKMFFHENLILWCKTRCYQKLISTKERGSGLFNTSRENIDLDIWGKECNFAKNQGYGE